MPQEITVLWASAGFGINLEQASTVIRDERVNRAFLYFAECEQPSIVFQYPSTESMNKHIDELVKEQKKTKFKVVKVEKK